LENDLCGNSTVAAIVAFATYFALAAGSFARPKWLVLGWPMAVVAGLAVFVALHAVVPGGHGHCDYFN
jgi:zinc transporter ZupT